MRRLNDDKAVVLFSGGQDSTTCLFWAKAHFREAVALSINYGQRHAVELEQARRIAALAGVKLRTLPVSSLETLGNSALTDPAVAVANEKDAETGLPSTFVPGRNLLFLTLAAADAYQRRARHLIGGMCQTDSAGYPDCRSEFLQTALPALQTAMEADFALHTPLLTHTKADTWRLAAELGCLSIVREETHTCYEGDRSRFHPWGYGCGRCTACRLRKQGYEEAFPGGEPSTRS